MWYAVDIRRLRFGELWYIAPGLGFLIGAGCKLFRIPLKMDMRVCMLSSVDRLDPGALDPDVREAMDPLVGSWRGLGFGEPLWYSLPMKGAGQRSAAAALLSRDRLTVAQVFFAEKKTEQLTQREVQANCVSAMGDGTYAGVSSGRRQMDSPPEFDGVYLFRRPPEALYARHEERLKHHRSSARPLREEELASFVLELHNLSVRFHADRGVYVPATD